MLKFCNISSKPIFLLIWLVRTPSWYRYYNMFNNRVNLVSKETRKDIRLFKRLREYPFNSFNKIKKLLSLHGVWVGRFYKRLKSVFFFVGSKNRN